MDDDSLLKLPVQGHLTLVRSKGPEPTAILLRRKDVAAFRDRFNFIEPLRQRGDACFISTPCIALTVDGPMQLDSAWYFEHATVATTGQVVLTFSGEQSGELIAWYSLEELEALVT
jgi:hypothetical protein